MSENAGNFTAPGMPRTDAEAAVLEVGTDESDLDALRAELTATPTVVDEFPTDDYATVPVPLRDGYAVVCRLDFTGKDLDRWRKSAADKTFADKLDGVKFSALLLGATCVAVLRQGRPVLVDGVRMTLQTREFQTLYGAANVDETVRKFFVREGHVDSAARTVAEAAGWGDQLYAMGPTS